MGIDSSDSVGDIVRETLVACAGEGRLPREERHEPTDGDDGRYAFGEGR